MWTLAIPSLLLCFSAVFTTDDPCDTCTSTYNGTDDTNCSALATYNACLKAIGTLENRTCQAGLNVSTLITNADTRLAACKKNACSPRPCKNGGKCNVTEGGNVTVGGSNYTCDCTSGYSGQDCDKGPCINYTCNNHGKCKADEKNQTKATCVCDSGYLGDHCQNGPCIDHSCNRHGKCKADEKDQTKAMCVCDHGYQGDQCQNAGASKEMSLLPFLATLLAANIIRMILT